MRIVRFGLLALIVGIQLAGPAAFGENHLSSVDERASIVDFGFAPTDLSVAVGDTIAWTNNGARPHTVSDRGGTFDTGPIQPKGQNGVTFSVAGTYYFFCRINPGRMNGVIEVEAGNEAPRALRIQASDPAREGDDLSFTPNELTVQTGMPIVLANVGGKPHTLTADDGSFDTGIVPPGSGGGKFAGANASVTVNRPGRHPFHCEVHPEVMKGVITAEGEEKEGGPAAASQAPREAGVKIVDFAFEPPEASVAAGGTVTWENTGNAPHTATFDDADLDTETIEPGNDAPLVAPAEPGSYSYRCNIHPARMRGTLVVLGANQPDPTKAQAVADAQPTGAEVSGGVTFLALVTGVGGAFMGGFAISAFVRNKMGQS
jgi:plastocyanin